MSSATIFFTSAHIAVLLLSLHLFLPELILQLCCYYCFSLALLITGSHIALISMLGQLRRFLWPNICADSLSLRIFQWCSLSMISNWSHRGRWSPFSLRMWSATPDFPASWRFTAFWCSWTLTWSGGCFSFIFPSAVARDSVHTVFSNVLLYGGVLLGRDICEVSSSF